MDYQKIISVIKNNSKSIIKLSLILGVILFLILLFIYPVKYKAVTKVLPPEQNELSGMNGLLLNSDISGILNLGSSAGNSQLYAEIIRSRTAAEFVIEKLSLQKYLDEEDIQLASEKLLKNINVEVNKEGIISISAIAQTPLFSRFSSKNDSAKVLSANIANAFADALDQINRSKLNSRIRSSREYIEEQLAKTEYLLDSAETSLKKFQELNKAVSLPEQLSASIETASKLKSEIMLTEIQIRTLSNDLKENNPELNSLRNKLRQLNNQYSKIEQSENTKDYFVAFGTVPEIVRQLAILTREVKIHNEIYLLLQKQYYLEKIQENRNMPTVAVLDKALPPPRPAVPRLIFHTIAGFVAIFMFNVLFFIFKESKFYQENLFTRKKDV